MLWDTPVTPYTRPPISTDLTTRDRPRDGNLTAICGNLTAICHILPSSTKSCQVLLGPQPKAYSAPYTY